MRQRYEYFIDQRNVKRFFRYCLLREHLHQLNTSGVYHISEIQKCSAATNVPYNTLRLDISQFYKLGLITKNGKHLSLHGLERRIKSLYELFKKHREQIQEHETINDQALFFSDLVKKRILYHNIIAQAKVEASKRGVKEGRVYMKTVKRQGTQLGESLDLHLSIGTIARLLNRSKKTAWEYVERLNESGIVKRRKMNPEYICHVSEMPYLKKIEDLYGRITVRNYGVYKRKANEYIFN